MEHRIAALLATLIVLPACSTKPAVNSAAPLAAHVSRPAAPMPVAAAPDAARRPDGMPLYFFMLDAMSPAQPEGEPALANLRSLGNQRVRTTAYCHDENDHVRFGHLAAIGEPLRFGSVCSAAADWSRYPVGTLFRIPSQPGVVYEVDDYGSALVGSNTIDLYRPTLGTMNAWGTREVEIEIIRWGSFHDSLRLMRSGVAYPHVRRMVDDIQKRLDQAGTSHPIQATPAIAINAPKTAA